MGKLILSLEDDEMSLFKKQYVSLGELQEEIDKLEEEGEKLDKRKKEYKAWKDKINFLIDMYNAKSKYKTYNRIN
jgi:hypothetical protein